MVWDGPAESAPTYLMTDNLLVDVQIVAEQLLEAAALADGRDRFKNNLWVGPPSDGGERLKRLASFVDSLLLLSTDPGHADFLKPDFARLSSREMRVPFPGRYGLDN